MSDVARFARPIGELMNQLSGPNGEKRFKEFLLWLKRVGKTILVTGIDRTLSNEQAIEAGDPTWWFKDQAELDAAPRFEYDHVELDFVEFNRGASIVEVDAIYTGGWVPDLVAVSRYMATKLEAADERPIVIQWGVRPDGTAACALWRLEGSRYAVSVRRDGVWWGRKCRFARVRKAGFVN